MARTQTVWDATGRQLNVRSVDAAEIIAAGGSYESPKAVSAEELHEDGTPKVTYTEAEAIEQNDGEDVAVKKGKKAK